MNKSLKKIIWRLVELQIFYTNLYTNKGNENIERSHLQLSHKETRNLKMLLSMRGKTRVKKRLETLMLVLFSICAVFKTLSYNSTNSS